MSELAPHRNPALFHEFLVRGYTAMALSSVPEQKFNETLQAKLCLGTLITLYDDFADRPSQCNPELLETLYQFNFLKSVGAGFASVQHPKVMTFARTLFEQMTHALESLPHYRELVEVLNFDLLQFYSANRWSSLVTAKPFLNNALENRLCGHHNMGMVIASMIDLMATEKIRFSELGLMREVFVMGQRFGRILNVLATRSREALDRDITGELATCANQDEVMGVERALRAELKVLRGRIRSYESQITTFSVNAYVEGLKAVQKLHETMEGTI